VEILGGKVGTAYAGGNAATVTESATITVKTERNAEHVDTVFAGNNQDAMDIQPTLNLISGKIGTVYCGGNAGIMTANSLEVDYLTYEFDNPEIEVENVFAGCNATSDENTANVNLRQCVRRQQCKRSDGTDKCCHQ
jgi:hypothetical protein